MSVITSCQSLSKSFSARPLFRDISFTVDDRDKLGLIGPNGSGKSTLLKILAGLMDPDDGAVVPRKGLRTAYVAQDKKYDSGQTIRDVVMGSLIKDKQQLDEGEMSARVETTVTRMGFYDFNLDVSSLSGGWRKRLSLAAELVKEPDFLLLDEPTNHLDLDGVLWLEDLLKSANFGYVVVSHDRNFLENVTNRTIELNKIYKDGYLSAKGPYSSFLTARAEYMVAQNNEQQALASKVRQEVEWLSRGARARQTKSVKRIRDAATLMDELDEVKSRNSFTTAVNIDFTGSGRRTKELVVCKGIEKTLGDKLLFADLDVVLMPGQKLGLLGTNGSGKTTLLRIIADQLQPDAGTVKRADGLRIVWFDQNREQLDQTITLKEALCPSGDSVTYRDRQMHVASWSKRFLFRPDQLPMPVSYLSGGEQARILIARLMLQPADILILDEPTNDLDIPSLEVLEESLQDFPGALVLVTHDRFMLDNISNQLLALDGWGGAEYFADYPQWESVRQSSGKKNKSKSDKNENVTRPQGKGDGGATAANAALTKVKPLSGSEKKELLAMHDTIEAAEAEIGVIKKRLEDPKLATNHVKLQEVMSEVEKAEKVVAKLYERWHDLEERAKATKI